MEILEMVELEVTLKFEFDRSEDGIIIIDRKAFIDNYEITKHISKSKWDEFEKTALHEYENPCEMSIYKMFVES